MSSTTQHTLLRRLLLLPGSRIRSVLALLALGVGTALLLLSISTWWNFNALVNGSNRAGSTKAIVVVGKNITDYNMASVSGNSFSTGEIAYLRSAPEVLDVGEIISAGFPVYAMMGGQITMATDLPLASVPDRFLDTIPDAWTWQPGDRNLPVLLSTQFLDIYNYVFAPGQGLPQLSRTAVKSIALKMQVGGQHGQVLTAHVAGFSDDIGAVLAPESFIAYGNKTFQVAPISGPSQLVLRVKDPSAASFISYLQQHGYTVNPGNLKWSRIRSIVEATTTITGLFALLLMGISGLVLVLFIQLTVSRSYEALILLGQLGYSSSFLRRFMLRRFMPPVTVAMAVALLIAVAVQVAASQTVLSGSLPLPALPGWPVWLAFAICYAMILILVSRSLRRALK